MAGLSDNPDLMRQRRNLMAMCVAILIFCIGDGSFDKAPTFLGSITLNNHSAAYFMVAVVFVYFWWRFSQYSKSKTLKALKTIQNKILQNVNTKGVFPSDDETASNSFKPNILVYTLRGRLFKKAPVVEKIVMDQVESQNEIFVKYYERPKLFLMETKVFFVSIYKHTSISDYIFPHLLAVITTAVGLYRIITN